MKKYLMTGMAAVTMCAAFTSCSHDEISNYTKAEINQLQAQAKYDAAFINAFGKPASNQTWGFGSTNNARTRAAAEFGWEVSEGFDAEFNKDFINYVKTALPEEESAGSKLNNYEFMSNGSFQFSFVYTQTSNEDKVGYYYYNPSTQTIADRTEVIMVNNIKDELGSFLQYGIPRDYAEGGIEWTGVQSGSGDAYWGYGTTVLKAKVFTVNVPAGYRVGFFLISKEGYQLYSNRELNNTDEATNEKFYYSAVVDKSDDAFLVGFEDWYYSGNNSVYDNHVADCNDVVIAINQKTSTPPTVIDPKNPDPVTPSTPVSYQGRIFAEDLSAEEEGDFDFNDVVFDWRIDGNATEGYVATIQLLAAGGTLELYVGGKPNEDATEIINGGVEVHNKFGVGTGTMVNTGLAKKDNPDAFTVAVTSNDANDIKLWVKKNGTFAELKADRGTPACKINVPVGTKWVDEYENIADAYNWFTAYVGGKTAEWNNVTNTKLVDHDLSNNK